MSECRAGMKGSFIAARTAQSDFHLVILQVFVEQTACFFCEKKNIYSLLDLHEQFLSNSAKSLGLGEEGVKKKMLLLQVMIAAGSLRC